MHLEVLHGPSLEQIIILHNIEAINEQQRIQLDYCITTGIPTFKKYQKLHRKRLDKLLFFSKGKYTYHQSLVF